MADWRHDTYSVQFHSAAHVRRRDGGEPLSVVGVSPRGVSSKCPVIIFSHGLGGRPRRLLGWAQKWARQGFICLLPAHHDSVGVLAREGAPGQKSLSSGARVRAEVHQSLASNGSEFESRVKDVRDLLDALGSGGRANGELVWGDVDTDAIGLAGHSIGAYVAQILGGARVRWGQGPELTSHRDARVRAVLLLSPQGAGRLGLCDESWADFDCPIMSVTGTRDRGARGEAPNWRRQVFDRAVSSLKYQLTVPGASHFGLLGVEDHASSVEADRMQALQAATGLFWQALLKQDGEAQAALEAGDFQPESAVSRLDFEVGHGSRR
ncbi:MAG: hypothetical protein P8M78_16985 [Myxococcota bacterium]|nr:hypothetical protein [Myxococcota bacterium]